MARKSNKGPGTGKKTSSPIKTATKGYNLPSSPKKLAAIKSRKQSQLKKK